MNILSLVTTIYLMETETMLYKAGWPHLSHLSKPLHIFHSLMIFSRAPVYMLAQDVLCKIWGDVIYLTKMWMVAIEKQGVQPGQLHAVARTFSDL